MSYARSLVAREFQGGSAGSDFHFSIIFTELTRTMLGSKILFGKLACFRNSGNVMRVSSSKGILQRGIALILKHLNIGGLIILEMHDRSKLITQL